MAQDEAQRRAEKKIERAAWPMFFTTWGTRIRSSYPVARFEAPRSKNPGDAVPIEW